MTYRHKSFLDAVPKHAGRPGPWAQMPWRILGMLFVAAVLMTSQPSTTAGAARDIPSPADHSHTPAGSGR